MDDGRGNTGREAPPSREGGHEARPRESFLASAAAEFGFPESQPCPFCGSGETRLHSPFGSALSVATYWCLGCRTAFEWIKWD